MPLKQAGVRNIAGLVMGKSKQRHEKYATGMQFWSSLCMFVFAICVCTLVIMWTGSFDVRLRSVLHLATMPLFETNRRNNRRKGTSSRMRASWDDHIGNNRSTDNVLKSEWLKSGLMLLGDSSPAMPEEIPTVGAGEDSQDESNGYRPGTKKKLHFQLQPWLSSIAYKIITTSFKNRKGKDKEHLMEMVLDENADMGAIEVPTEQKFQWMVDSSWRQGGQRVVGFAGADGGVIARAELPFELLPNMFEVEERNIVFIAAAGNSQLQLVGGNMNEDDDDDDGEDYDGY